MDIAKLKALADQLPSDLYKAKCSGAPVLNGLVRDGKDGEYHWWLDIQCGAGGECDICTPHLDTVLDIACEFKALVAEYGRLQEQVDGLIKRNLELAEQVQRLTPKEHWREYRPHPGWTHEHKPGDPEPHFEGSE
jgi:hypothetical protein